MFLNAAQQSLAREIAALLIARNETVAVAEGAAGGLISAALLSVPGASRYYAGGVVAYTLNSRIVLSGVPAEEYTDYRSTTLEMVASLAEHTRQRLGATWAIAESGIAGPTGGRAGAPPGRVTIGIAGPVHRAALVETGLPDREANMVEFATHSLGYLRDVLREAG